VLLGRAITQRGRALLMFGRPGAEGDIDAGIRIAESVRDTTGLMSAMSFKGFARWTAGKSDEASRCFERRLMLAERAHAPVDEAWARTSLGMVFHANGDQKRAKQEYERALALFHAAGTRRFEIEPLIGLGRVASADGDGPASIRWYRRALAVSQETGDRRNEMWAANNLAVMLTKQGDLSQSWEYLKHANALARELQSPWGMLVPAYNLANGLEELGDFETAESVLDQARALCESVGATDQLPTVDFQLGILRMGQGRNASAVALFRSLTAKPDVLEEQHRDLVFVHLANALAASDSVDTAIQVLSDRLKTRGRTFYGDVLPPANLVLGRLYEKAGDSPKALTYARRAREVAIPTGQKSTMVAAMLLESECCRAAGEAEKAAVTFQAALDSLDQVRGGISTPEWREVYGQSVAQEVADAGIILLEYPESLPRVARERAFFDAMQRVKTRALMDRISHPHSGTTDDKAPLSNRVATLAGVQAALRPGETVLDFSVGNRHSFLAAITTDSLRIVEPGNRSSLEERVRLLRTVVASTDAALRAEYDVARLHEVQRGLSRDILGGVSDLVERSNLVLVCPDGYFSAIPFGLLITPYGNDVLMQNRDVIQIPSVSVLVLERSDRKDEAATGRKVVAISASDRELSGAREEVRDLAHRYRNVDQFTDLRDVDAFAEAVKHGDALHIASHALMVDRAPWWSGIQLRRANNASDTTGGNTRGLAEAKPHLFVSAADSLTAVPSDPYVRAWQIAKLDIPAQLAVLSACETAGGRMTTGEGTIGLTAAFLSAGVPVVVSSLWPVDDRATAFIMRSFYRNLSRGESVATALRHAQLDASHMSRWSHPFYWSGFTVIGDGARRLPIERRLVTWTSAMTVAAGVLLLAATGLFIRRRRARAVVA
jgi:CHAT domain-containing protein/tetratricopeptide (TPR) repeat protein